MGRRNGGASGELPAMSPPSNARLMCGVTAQFTASLVRRSYERRAEISWVKYIMHLCFNDANSLFKTLIVFFQRFYAVPQHRDLLVA